MSGEMLRPLEGRPYLDFWQKRMAEPKPAKVKPKPRKRKKARK